MYFISYTRVFERAKHKEIIMFWKIHFIVTVLRIVKSICGQQKTGIKIDNQFQTFQHIEQGLRQGCVRLPNVFSLYSEIIIRSIQYGWNISWGT